MDEKDPQNKLPSMEDIQQFGRFHVLDLTSNHPEFDDHDRIMSIAYEEDSGIFVDICLQWQRNGIIFSRSVSLPKGSRPYDTTMENIRDITAALRFSADVLSDRFRAPAPTDDLDEDFVEPKPKRTKKKKVEA